MYENFNSVVKKLLEDIAIAQKLENYTIAETTGCRKGDGYSGNITALDMKGTSNSKEKVLKFIVKSAPKSKAARSTLAVVPAFHREIYMYETIIPTLKTLIAKKDVPPISSFVKCYATTTEEFSESLVLQNIKPEGFVLLNRKEPTDGDHVNLIMKTLGEFHAVVFAFKDQQYDIYNTLAQPIKEVDIRTLLCPEDVPQMLDTICNFAFASVCSRDDEIVSEACKKFQTDIVELYDSFNESNEEYSIILHGDCWINNMMFAYDDENKPNKPTRMRLFDLQLARMGLPVLDLLFCFYSTSSRDVIEQYEHYLDVYYDSFSTYLKQLGSDPEKLYPYKVFRQQWQENAKFGLFSAMLLLRLMLVEEHEVIDLTEAIKLKFSDMCDNSMTNIGQYNSRIKDIILHLVDNGFM